MFYELRTKLLELQTSINSLVPVIEANRSELNQFNAKITSELQELTSSLAETIAKNKKTKKKNKRTKKKNRSAIESITQRIAVCENMSQRIASCEGPKDQPHSAIDVQLKTLISNLNEKLALSSPLVGEIPSTKEEHDDN